MGISNICHNDSLQMLNEKLFEGILGIEHLVSKKKSITIDKVKYYGYFLEKAKELYFIEDLPNDDKNVLDLLPIKVTKKTETDYNKNVFYFISGYDSVKIPDEKKLSFKQIVDTIGNFKHTNPRHWLLYKIITIAARMGRINYRVIAERGFGKDSVINNIQDLVGNMKNIYGATFANLEYSLKYKFLVFNEMGNPVLFLLLVTGTHINPYSKRSGSKVLQFF